MTSVAERRRVHKQTRRLEPEKSQVQPTLAVIPKAAPKRQGGLQWLVAKKRINRRQEAAGTCYGVDGRLSAVSGLAPLRSCLSDDPRGGTGGGVPFAIYETEAKDRYATAQAALSYHPDMLAALELICVRDLTPWESLPNGTQKDVSRLETTLVIALDLLVRHYRL